MYNYIIGVITYKEEGKIVLENNGIGYEINVSNQILNFYSYDNQPVKLYTYLAVREDEISLFGFASKEEKDLFLKLITVSGVGPKLALSVLSGMNISDLTVAICKEDVKLLSKVKGLGKKTAERICLELKDKVTTIGLPIETSLTEMIDEDAVDLATETLVSLGINKNEAYRLARSYAGENVTAEEIISKALRSYRSWWKKTDS